MVGCVHKMYKILGLIPKHLRKKGREEGMEKGREEGREEKEKERNLVVFYDLPLLPPVQDDLPVLGRTCLDLWFCGTVVCHQTTAHPSSCPYSDLSLTLHSSLPTVSGHPASVPRSLPPET